MLKTYTAPSREIGESNGMSFLWNDWGLEDHAKISNTLLYGDKEESSKLYDNILNYLSDIEPRFTRMDPWWVVMGVVSQYNFEDIEYFCDVDPWNRDPLLDVEQRKRKWNNKGWIISPQTLAKVFEAERIAA